MIVVAVFGEPAIPGSARRDLRLRGLQRSDLRVGIIECSIRFLEFFPVDHDLALIRARFESWRWFGFSSRRKGATAFRVGKLRERRHGVSARGIRCDVQPAIAEPDRQRRAAQNEQREQGGNDDDEPI